MPCPSFPRLPCLALPKPLTQIPWNVVSRLLLWSGAACSEDLLIGDGRAVDASPVIQAPKNTSIAVRIGLVPVYPSIRPSFLRLEQFPFLDFRNCFLSTFFAFGSESSFYPCLGFSFTSFGLRFLFQPKRGSLDQDLGHVCDGRQKFALGSDAGTWMHEISDFVFGAGTEEFGNPQNVRIGCLAEIRPLRE